MASSNNMPLARTELRAPSRSCRSQRIARLASVALGLGMAALCAQAASAADAAPLHTSGTPVRVGIVSTSANSAESSFIRETLERLRSGFAPRTLTVDVLDGAAAASDMKARDSLAQSHDLLIAPSEFLLQDEALGGFTRLVTKARRAGERYADTGGTTVVVRADRRDIRSLDELSGKSIAAPSPDALSGWLSLLGEIKVRHRHIDDFFARTDFVGGSGAVIEAVLSGRADAGALPVCLLEYHARTKRPPL